MCIPGENLSRILQDYENLIEDLAKIFAKFFKDL